MFPLPIKRIHANVPKILPLWKYFMGCATNGLIGPEFQRVEQNVAFELEKKEIEIIRDKLEKNPKKRSWNVDAMKHYVAMLVWFEIDRDSPRYVGHEGEEPVGELMFEVVDDVRTKLLWKYHPTDLKLPAVLSLTRRGSTNQGHSGWRYGSIYQSS